MGFFRLTFLWLCSTSMLFAGVLNQGFVLCVTADGQIRVEARGKSGKCYQSNLDSHEGIKGKTFEAFTASPPHACDDLTVGTRTSPLPTNSITALSQLAPLPLTTVAVFNDLVLLPAVKHAISNSNLDPPILSDTFFVRKTVSLLI